MIKQSLQSFNKQIYYHYIHAPINSFLIMGGAVSIWTLLSKVKTAVDLA